jgi:putative flippase GtrA
MRRLLAPRGTGLFGQIVRYILASGVALAIDIGLLLTLVESGLHYLLANAIAFTAGALIGFLLCITWVFPARRIQHAGLAFGVFALIGLVGLLVNTGVLALAWEVLDLPGRFGLGPRPGLLLCKAAAALVSFAWNFSARKILLFR